MQLENKMPLKIARVIYIDPAGKNKADYTPTDVFSKYAAQSIVEVMKAKKVVRDNAT